MSRAASQRVVVWTGVVLVCAATLYRFHARGGPYFAAPATVLDRVSAHGHETRDVVILLPQVEPQIPDGANVTVFRPLNGRAHNDHNNYLAAVGLLPRHQVLPPFTAFDETPRENLVDWVVAIREPFEHPHYRVVAGFSNGWLYKVDR